MKVTRGKKHIYLGMILNYYSKEKLKVNIACYTKNMVEEFPKELSCKGKVLWNNSLLEVNIKSPTLDAEKAESFHNFIIKGIFLPKRARPDLEPSFAFY